MTENPAAALKELTGLLKEWLAFQGRLGWQGTAPSEEVKQVREPGAAAPTPTLKEIREAMEHCRKCKLGRGRTNLVFGEGSPNAEIMFIGEAPGEEEDRQGRPFVGPAGQVLNNLLNKLGLSREEVYITNVVKSRPPNNRDPEPDEIAACLPFLQQQIKAIRPKVIVALGRIAAQTLLNTREPITKLRGRWHKYDRIPVMPTFHPSYLLRFPRERIKTWQDMQLVMERLAADE
ncbi:MAG: uracil-DNA glycosylase [Deltaproteobacteria bacterium]|nr:uracil-DNA glycosylase [Deltaproteobacteria bacterium]